MTVKLFAVAGVLLMSPCNTGIFDPKPLDVTGECQAICEAASTNTVGNCFVHDSCVGDCEMTLQMKLMSEEADCPSVVRKFTACCANEATTVSCYGTAFTLEECRCARLDECDEYIPQPDDRSSNNGGSSNGGSSNGGSSNGGKCDGSDYTETRLTGAPQGDAECKTAYYYKCTGNAAGVSAACQILDAFSAKSKCKYCL